MANYKILFSSEPPATQLEMSIQAHFSHIKTPREKERDEGILLH